MKIKTMISGILFTAVLTGAYGADLKVVRTTGVGSRAYGLANNFVALSNDQSGLFWNPAGLAFAPAREFQVSFDALSQRTSSDFFGQPSSSVVQRLRLDNIGYMHAFPTSQGGFTIAGAFQSPLTFDDMQKFSGSYISSNGNTVNESRDAKVYGALNYWTGGFGLQVAEGLGIGASFSFVTGSENGQNIFYKDTNGRLGDSIYDDYDRIFSRSYLGYDIRVGLLYNFLKNFNLGLRFVFPQTIWFTEDMTETNSQSPNLGEYAYPAAQGRLFSSYSGAIGLSGVFQRVTFSTEFRARAPYSFAYPSENIPEGSGAAKTLVGAGLGLEGQVIKNAMLLRAGYSWDQYDTHVFASQYDDPKDKPNWDPNGEAPVGDQHLATIGTAFLMKNTCLEFTYGYNFWKLETSDVLTQTHTQNRFMTSLSFRF
jgi:hypothetical protein